MMHLHSPGYCLSCFMQATIWQCCLGILWQCYLGNIRMASSNFILTRILVTGLRFHHVLCHLFEKPTHLDDHILVQFLVVITPKYFISSLEKKTFKCNN